MNGLSKEVALLGVGILLKHIWDKFRGRIIYLHHTIWHQSLGSSISSEAVGSIQISYNDTPVQSLYLSTLILENRSGKDISDLEVNIACDSSSAIILSEAVNEANLKDVDFTDEFKVLLGSDLIQNPGMMTKFLGRRDYLVPVLNRQDRIRVSMLVSNGESRQPIIDVVCEQPGLKLKYVKDLPLFLKEPQHYCAWFGSALVLLLCWPLVKYVPAEYSHYAVFGAAALGILAMLVGWAAIKIVKGITHVIG